MLIQSILCLCLLFGEIYSVPFEKNDIREEKQLERKHSEISDEKAHGKKTKVDDSRTNSHKAMIDKENVDPNDDELMTLLEGMAVGKNGKIYKAKGLHPELSAAAKGMDMEIEPPALDEMKRERRNFLRTAKKWPKNIIPYKIDIRVTSSIDMIKKAIDIYNKRTCLRWLPFTDELATQVGHNSYINFIDGTGCWSKIGFYRGFGAQSLSIDTNSCIDIKVITHEMMHAAGFEHEQSRSDRDDYIRLIKENLGDMYYTKNFRKSDTLDRNPYDYQSVMQYSLNSFSVNGKPTIEFKDKDLEFLAGSGTEEGIDFYDVKDIITNFQCAANCSSPPKCVNGGFVNHNCVCYCPGGYTGATCETVITDTDCGGIVNVPLGRDVFVQSPNYPTLYPLGKICRWGVKSPKGTVLHMTVEELHLAENWLLARCYHWLEIQYNLPGQTGIKRCGVMAGNKWSGSKDSPNVITIKFDSKFVQSVPAKKGFKLKFNAVKENENTDECLRSGYGGEYKGKTNVTRRGLACQAWSKQTPHAHNFNVTLANESNYCRNPSPGSGSFLPWCYTMDPNKRWDYCYIPPCEYEECTRSKVGYEYNGRVSKTASGKTCQRWDSQSPHNHGYGRLAAHENYCRNFYGQMQRPFCYTTNSSVRWEYCEIPACSAESKARECTLTQQGFDYFGKVNRTRSGRTCQRWDTKSPHSHDFALYSAQENYCRNILDIDTPWCLTTDPDPKWYGDYCDIPMCDTTCYSNPCLNGGTCQDNGKSYTCTCLPTFKGDRCQNEVNCKRSTLGWEYNSTAAVTRSGRTCQRWNETTPHNHNFTYLADHENYCRNPDREPGGPWCYTTDPNKRSEYCDIPACVSPPNECLTSAKGLDYFGHVNTTVSGRTCQRWDSQSPHTHTWGKAAEQGNYCRNPYGKADGPGCYTTDSSKAWEYCNIPCFMSAP